MSEQSKDAERAAFEAWRLEKFCAGVERLKKCSNAPDVYYYSAEQEAWKVWKARASLPVGVPEGYMPIPTAEQLADALENVRCFHDMSAELIAPRLLANLLAAPTVKESLSVAPSLPAAGSAELIAEAERCLFVLREIGSMDADDITGDDVDLRFEDEEGRDTGCDVSIVDYAEKSADVIEKMIAALSAQQSAHVSVPRELLERICWSVISSSDLHTHNEAVRELRALLNGGEA
ncbi:hypothetical protein DBO86_22990 [Pseudomonas indoloxydans]|uniref:Uncharacterized protein n=1 Tax=Ectopseudomonas oleovorans TaxID=301 RepID=A0A2T5PGL8_ECTOL|nr:hypothetical protein [Pseudomonas indoloxydans]PTU76865.1 hypothetical protein DBO86_22990 [Pseudomonas indoloxydans]